MKKIQSLLLLFFLCQGMIAQDNNLFVIYTDNGIEKKVLNMQKDTNKLVILKKPVAVNDTFFDAFIIKPSIDNPHRVYLISAQENNLFLKRNGDTIEFKDINLDSNTNKSSYEWEIQYFGNPFIAISDPSNLKKVIFLENDTLVMKVAPVENWGLVNNIDTKSNAFRFKIRKIANSF